MDNFKNITDGAVHLNAVDNNDKARAGFSMDYRDNPFDVFE